MARVGTNTSNIPKGDRYDLLIFKFTEGYPAGNIKLAFGETPKKIGSTRLAARFC